MDFPPDYAPDWSYVRQLLLQVAQERTPEGVLRMVVDQHRDRPHVALVRIWLIDADPECPDCAAWRERRGGGSCLHVVASGWARRADESDRSWLRGTTGCVPVGEGQVGRVAATGKQEHIREDWAATISGDELAWAKRERVMAFNGQPIVYRGEVLGVYAGYVRVYSPPHAAEWQRVEADHIAVALVNARAFQQIERLKRHLELENAYLQEEVAEARAFGEMLGESAAVRALGRQIELVAPTDANVLIQGESGTGKELVARELHRRSGRAERPMIKVNCASVPKDLFESEFFGHVRGSFTGAVRDRLGRFELANGGTLFLDEVGEIPLEMQGKLLRVLQEGEFERVGEERTRRVDVRVIAATNRELHEEVEQGRFRQDLFYRLGVFPIEVPPLRSRKEDIPLLASAFLEREKRKLKRPRLRLTQAAVQELQGYDWPGNIRQLQNTVERAAILTPAGPLRFDLPGEGTNAPVVAPSSAEEEVLTDAEMKRRERENIIAALRLAGGKVSGPGGAAEILGLNPGTLASRITAMRIEKPRPTSTQ